MSGQQSAFSSFWFVPDGEARPVVEVNWNLGKFSAAIAEVAHDPVRNRRVLRYWTRGEEGSTRLPLFDFLEALSQAYASLHYPERSRPAEVRVGQGLQVQSESSTSAEIRAQDIRTPIARVRSRAPGLAVVEIWEPDLSQPLQLPLHETMLALFEASIRLDKVEATLAL